MGGEEQSVADAMESVLAATFDDQPQVRFEFWDGSALGPQESVGVVHLTSPDALRRIVWSPGELGFGRAFIVGDVDITGSVADVLRALQAAIGHKVRIKPTDLPLLVQAGRKLGALGRPLAPPVDEMTPSGLRHSIGRDKKVVSQHYNVGNEFYALVLGSSMTYSCARFVDLDEPLEDAQAAKHDLVCRKLGLDEVASSAVGGRPRLLDVGCGWGSMAIHAATNYGVDVVGVTISDEQATLARKRVAEAGLGDRVEIRVEDYRELSDGRYDAISSIGMAEHVGKSNMESYFAALHAQLRPGGRILNHAISSIGGSMIGRRSFVGRYVFPDGELLDLADTITAMQDTGFEVRDVENLREHYAETLRRWVVNLESNWARAVDLVGEPRTRVWQLYMSGSINGFFDGGLQLHQTLGVKPIEGKSLMPATRRDWV